MRASAPRAWALLAIGVVTFVIAVAGGACATGSGALVGGAGGSGPAATGGHKGTGGDTGTGGTMDAGNDGPVACLHASDCAVVADACNNGDCLNNVCVKTPANDGAACDDGLFCTAFDTCSMGTCMGMPKTCPSTDPCQAPSCDEGAKMCVNAPVSDGTPCTLSNDVCFLSAFCQSGACTGGTQMSCAFLDATCTVGVCDPMLGCQATPAAEGASCNDGLFCTVNDACHNGACSGVPMTCGPTAGTCTVGTCNESSHACVSVTAPDGTSCVGTNPCLVGQTCSAGACIGGTPASPGMACVSTNACMTNATCGNGVCSGSLITTCVGGDGCCPSGCTPMTDSDCMCGLDVALNAVGSISDGGTQSPNSPAELSNGIGESQCTRFSWIFTGNSSPPAAQAWFELDWTSPIWIASMFIETPQANGQGTCVTSAGRNVASADVQMWNGSSWVTVTSFSGKSGNFEIDIQPQVQTTKVRLNNVLTAPGNGSADIYEWHVYGTPGCVPPAD